MDTLSKQAKSDMIFYGLIGPFFLFPNIIMVFFVTKGGLLSSTLLRLVFQKHFSCPYGNQTYIYMCNSYIPKQNICIYFPIVPRMHVNEQAQNRWCIVRAKHFLKVLEFEKNVFCENREHCPDLFLSGFSCFDVGARQCSFARIFFVRKRCWDTVVVRIRLLISREQKVTWFRFYKKKKKKNGNVTDTFS